MTEQGFTISTEVEDEVGASQLEAALGNLGVTRWNSFVEAYFILLGENQLKSGIDLKGLRVTSYEGGGQEGSSRDFPVLMVPGLHSPMQGSQIIVHFPPMQGSRPRQQSLQLPPHPDAPMFLPSSHPPTSLPPSGVNKLPFAWPFQARQFQNPDVLQTVSEIFTCYRQFWTKQIWKNMR